MEEQFWKDSDDILSTNLLSVYYGPKRCTTVEHWVAYWLVSQDKSNRDISISISQGATKRIKIIHLHSFP